MDDQERREDGTYAIRPQGAADLFDSESGRAAARKRWEKERKNTELALIAKVQEELGEDDVTLDEAINFAINHPLIKKALEGNVPALKFLVQKLDLVPQGSEAKVVVDARQAKQYNFFNFDTADKALAYAQQLEDAGRINVAQAVRSQIVGDAPYTIQIEV